MRSRSFSASKYNVPIYVKIEKLEIKLVSEKNIDQVWLELKEYAIEVDLPIGRQVVQLERVAEGALACCSS